MYSSTSSPKLLLEDIYKSSLEAIDRNTIDDHYVCELDFIDPLTDWQTDSFESVAIDYLCGCLPSPSSNDLASSDLLIHIQNDITNDEPSVQLDESTISVFNEETDNNWKGLGLSFDKKSNSAFVEWKAKQPPLSGSCKPKRYSSLQKRCIRFLKDINNHKIPQPLSYANSSANRRMPFSYDYDKLAIHHVVAERKRREQMTDLFSDLRALVPVKPKVTF